MNPAFAIALAALVGVLGLMSIGRRAKPNAGIPGKLIALIAGIGVTAALIAMAPRLAPLLLGGLGLFLMLRRLARTGPQGRAGGGAFGRGGAPRQPSTVKTPYLQAELDHETGDMDGEVLNGPWRGCRLSGLTRAELVKLLAYLKRVDGEGARIVEAYLDRNDAGWRTSSDAAGAAAGDNDSGWDGGEMSVARALQVLGLEQGATDDEVVAAHRRLINRLHPDRGGSSYLAAEINAAKDCLLKQR